MTKIYVGANPNKKTDKHPSHLIKLIPDDDAENAEWIDIGALWEAKSGNGWSGSLQDYVKIEIDQQKMAEVKKPKDGEPKSEATPTETTATETTANTNGDW